TRALPTRRTFVARPTLLASYGGSSRPPIHKPMPITKALVQRAATKFSLTTDQILTVGLTPAQEAQLSADSAFFQPLDSTSTITNVPGGGKSFQHRAQSPLVVKGEGRVGDYLNP